MTRRLLLLGFPALLFLSLIGMLVLASPARASTTITVTTTLDQDGAGGGCSLREAIIAANRDIAFGGCPAGSGADIIILPDGTYVMTHSVRGDNTAMTGDLDITSTVTISGTGAALTIVDGNGFDRVFDILTATVQFKGITIRNGDSDTQDGGGVRINASGVMTFTDSALIGNMTATGGNGGGVYNAGTVTLISSAVLSNTTIISQENGAGLYNAPTGIMSLVNTTISGNRAGRSGGALYNNGGTVILSNVTVTNNVADADADDQGDGGGIRNQGGTVTIRNSLIAGNLDNSAGLNPTINPDCNGTLTSQEYNLLGIDKGCTFTALTGDQVGTASSPIDPKVGPLQNNGGPTLTHALLSGSPALDAGNPATPGSGSPACEAADQRGVLRVYGAACDIGAYELRTSMVVNSTVDAVDALLTDGVCQTATPGQCTLRAAIQEANALTGPDLVILPPGIYLLTRAGGGEDNAVTGDLDIADSVTLTGGGAATTIVDGGALDRVFDVASPTAVVVISDLTIQNGAAVDLFAGVGGGISNSSTLTLLRSVVSNNQASSSSGGGGLANFGALTITASTIMSNTAPNGGGLASYGGVLVLKNGTISGNSALVNGGGLFAALTSTLNINNVTVASNTAGSGGGGIALSSNSTAAVGNTILAGNVDMGGLAPDCSGVVMSQDYNLIQSTSGCTVNGMTAHNKSAAANLGPLQNSGDPTPTHALLPGSPAIDAGNPALPGSGGNACEAVDQRGQARIEGIACDMGAYEFVFAKRYLPLILRGP